MQIQNIFPKLLRLLSFAIGVKPPFATVLLGWHIKKFAVLVRFIFLSVIIQLIQMANLNGQPPKTLEFSTQTGSYSVLY